MNEWLLPAKLGYNQYVFLNLFCSYQVALMSGIYCTVPLVWKVSNDIIDTQKKSFFSMKKGKTRVEWKTQLMKQPNVFCLSNIHKLGNVLLANLAT